jgi:hypothetical protein
MKSINRLTVIAVCLALLAGYGFIQQPGDKKEKMKGQDKSKTEKMSGQDNQRKTIDDKKSGTQSGSDKEEKMGSGERRGGDDGKTIYRESDSRGDQGKKGDKGHKITICHKTGGHPVTISISERAWPAHQAHGDVQGECGATAAQKKVDGVEKKRVKLYNSVAEAEDLVLHSLDVIDLARERIRLARLSIEAARKSGKFTAAELDLRANKVLLVETRAADLEMLVATTRNDLKAATTEVEVVVAL